MKFGNDKPHLEAPVSKMNITNGIVSAITSDTLYTLTDNSSS